jgi:murein DD-endopeptidase MepM/ murein hydrolase activator NlpD
MSAFGRQVHAFPLGAGRWRALVGIDLDVTPGAYTLTAEARSDTGPLRATQPITVLAKRFPTRTLRVAEAYVNPPKAVQDRIASEAARLAAIWTASPAVPLWTGAFVRPVRQAANSAFGTRSVFNGQPRSPHGGADFLSPAGTPVAAPNAGRVVLADDLYYTGNTIVIDHGGGLVSLFAHLSTRRVREGATVSAGEIIGLVGATGRVTGPHLHWTLRANGARVDPLSLLAVLGAPAGHDAGQ